MKSEAHSLVLPSPTSAPPGAGPITSVQSEGSIVVVGANGSGKTRLGTWIEFESGYGGKVRRFAAQKSLAMPESAASIAVDQALSDLLYGYPEVQFGQDVLAQSRIYRWQRKPVTALLTDFDTAYSSQPPTVRCCSE